jgi:hypothetical protein
MLVCQRGFIDFALCYASINKHLFFVACGACHRIAEFVRAKNRYSHVVDRFSVWFGGGFRWQRACQGAQALSRVLLVLHARFLYRRRASACVSAIV